MVKLPGKDRLLRWIHMDERDTQTAAPSAEPDGAAVADTAVLGDPAQQLAAITTERDQLAREKAEVYDRLLRRQAEFDNYRRRVEKERSDIFEFAGMEAVRALVPILDDFERALKVESADADYAKGMALIYQRMFDAMTKLGLEPIQAVNQKFDPNLHHAVDRLPTEDVEEDTVLDEYQRGYNFKGRLLRPAMVRVAVKP